MVKLHFLGAIRQVTGSRYCLEAGGLRLLIDCGLFQERDFLGRNWETCPIPAGTIDHVLLTHAHLDHGGLLPKLVREGFRGPILATGATRDLAEIVLKDSAHIQEEDSAFKQKRHARERRVGPYPVQPLYTQVDAEAVSPLFQVVPYNRPTPLNENVAVTYHDAGHILGSAMLEITVRGNGAAPAISRCGDARTLIFSGDIGVWNKPIIRDPSLFERADYVVMESTYGDRDHVDSGPIEDQLAEAVNTTVRRGGNVIIPTFAIERAQELMYYLGRLVREDRIPRLLVFLDSPMAVDVTDVFLHHRECMDEEAVAMLESGEPPCRFPGLKMIREVAESKAINQIKGSCVIMAGAGMCNAGRIKHHLKNNIGSTRNTILFVGYQAVGTLGRQIVDGRKTVRIHGANQRVRARVAQIHGLSGHADRDTLLRWVGNLKKPPRRVFLTHGEEDVSLRFADLVHEKCGWPVYVPQYREQVELD
jgi:metallo-beta-lactamase family protein